MRRKGGVLLMALGGVLILAAAALLGYNRWDDHRAAVSLSAVQSALEEAVTSAESSPLPSADSEDTQPLEAEPVTEMGTVEIDGYAYIGTLRIPALELELPILSEWSYEGLRIAPGRYCGSAWTDDLVLCGHNYTSHFGNLKYLEPGDALYFTDVDAHVFGYEVLEILILQPEAVEEMCSTEAGEWDLTLFTCTVGGQARVTVRCGRTS